MKCTECGGDCSPECGIHPMGCVYGGFSRATSYWLIAKGCTLNHGEQAKEEGKVPAQENATCPQILAAENEGMP